MKFEKLFEETLARVGMGKAGIAVGIKKGDILVRLALYSCTVPGEMAEVGAFTGGSARLIAKTVPSKKLHVYDTFEGMGQVFDKDKDGAGFETEFSGIPGLFELAKRVNNDCPNVKIYKGLFPDTVKGLPDKKYAFVHADADVYKSTKDICEYYYPRLSVGAVMIFDDYGYIGAPGCKQAVNEFFADRPESPSVLTTGQAVVIKTYEAPK